jgi:hypothetical protein
MDDEKHIKVSDEDIQKIINANEAGTADLMTFYESAEASYVAAAAASASEDSPQTAAHPTSTDSTPLT